ncbi:MAG: hypothetical protein ABEJ99_02030 [Candidatus Nanohaloarchaea archaeon]
MEELLTEGFEAVLEGDYERAYDVLSTDIDGYTGTEYVEKGFTDPDSLLNIVAREEDYEKLPEHLNGLLHGSDEIYDLSSIRSKVHRFAGKFAE